jgi:hypothetical protein
MSHALVASWANVDCCCCCCCYTSGDLTFNPEKDTLVGADGREVHLESPYGDELPAQVSQSDASMCALGRGGGAVGMGGRGCAARRGG